MQASNGETKGLGGIAGRGRLSWEKVVAEDWAMRRHAPSIGQARGGCCRGEVTCMEALDTLVVAGDATGV